MNSTGGPQTIYLIRHGEKLGDPGGDKDGGPHLSITGSARAAAIPSLFFPHSVKHGTPALTLSCELDPDGEEFEGTYVRELLNSLASPRFATPDFLFATSYAQPAGASRRPYETILPLATALNLTINTDVAVGDEGQLANEITTAVEYAGKVILVAWHHGTLQALARAIGGGVSDAPTWPGTTFDWLWEIDYVQDRHHVIRHTQALLYGDAPPSAARRAVAVGSAEPASKT